MIELHHGDCLDYIDKIKFDVIITDPPYPDYHVDIYGKADITWMNGFDCRQLVFWSAKVDFPLDYTAIHVWDKMIGAGSMYERIFERNGGKNWRVFNIPSPTNSVRASMALDKVYNHPSQKPVRLMRELLEKSTKKKDIIFDPYMGSGSTGEACVNLGRNFVGIEQNKEYFDIAKKRIETAQPALL